MTATTTTAPTTRPAARAARPNLPPRAWQGLRVEREDISFVTVRPGVLLVEVTVHNDGPDTTPPTAAILQSAPLGAFVPWKPLALVTVPSLGPGESTVVREEIRFETPQALGTPDKLPPDRVLTALGLGEPDRNRNVPQAPSLAQDLFALVGQGGVHWAGNLNLFFPGQDVERHAAMALRIEPGCTNLAMFIVGGPPFGRNADEYRFRLTGDAAAWNARLFDAMLGRPIAEGVHSAEVKEGFWHVPACGMILLAVQPPAGATSGAVNVHVRQRSTDREAVVEFTMDARAAGPGCYKL